MSNSHTQSQLPLSGYGYLESKLHYCFIAGWLLFTGLRVFVLAVLPLDLSGDEAYYWEWGQQLAWGYYSKPPGIGWLMALAGWAGGNTTFGIRLFAVILGAAGLWLFYALGRRLYGVRVGMVAAFLFALTPASAGLNLILTIDAPLMFFWMGALVAFWRFVESDGNSPTWAAVLIFCLAGGILSKQMMLVFYPLAVIFLIATPQRRAVLRSPWLWVAFIVSLAALLPPLYWNSQNQWITFQHTLHHFNSDTTTLMDHFSLFFGFIGASMGLVTPVLWVLIMGVILASLFSWKHLGPRERYLWVFSAPGLLVLTLMALRQRVHANWPAVYLPAAILITTAWAAAQWTPGRHLAGWRRAFRPACMVAAVFLILVYGVTTVFSLGWICAPEYDPMRRMEGWRQLAGEIAAVHGSLPDSDETLIITQSHRFITSELAFYLPDHPRVYRYNPQPLAITSQHDLWETPAAHLGQDALIVVQGLPEKLSDELKSRFESVRFLKEVDLSERYNRRFALFLGKALLSWPERDDSKLAGSR